MDLWALSLRFSLCTKSLLTALFWGSVKEGTSFSQIRPPLHYNGLGTSSIRAMLPKASLGAQNPCVNTSPALALSQGGREPCEITLLLIPATLASLQPCNFVLISWSPWALCMPLVTCGPSQCSKLPCLLKTAAKVPPSQAGWQRQ